MAVPEPASVRYAASHASPKGAGDARPTAHQVVVDEGVEGALPDKVILITGASAGLGLQTAKDLHSTGASLYLVVRNVEKGRKALVDSGILVQDGGRAELIEMDLASLESVRKGAKEFLEKSGGKLNILIENAGVMAIPKIELTTDGFEMHFGINHIGHFLLFQLLKDALLSSSTPSFHSRVVILSSFGHNFSGINKTGDYSYEKTPEKYQPFVGYGQSKTANIYMACEIERRYGSKGLHGLAVHPGGIVETELSRHLPTEGPMAEFFKDPSLFQRPDLKNLEQGAATTVVAAIAKEWEGKGGLYLADCAPAVPLGKEIKLTDLLVAQWDGHANYIYNPSLEARLWKDSLEMVGMRE